MSKARIYCHDAEYETSEVFDSWDEIPQIGDYITVVLVDDGSVKNFYYEVRTRNLIYHARGEGDKWYSPDHSHTEIHCVLVSTATLPLEEAKDISAMEVMDG